LFYFVLLFIMHYVHCTDFPPFAADV